jgi:hypothetical protein
MAIGGKQRVYPPRTPSPALPSRGRGPEGTIDD